MLVTFAGCPKLQGERANEPLPDPDETAAAAMAEYDKNGDGSLSQEEFNASPGLVVASGRMDADGNGQISEAEVLDYFELYEEADLTLEAVTVTVSLDGAPLEGATVTLVPESILGDSTRPAVGVTDASGQCKPVAAGAKYPGAQIGLYRVSVSKDAGGREQVPAKYNSATELGIEVSSLAHDEMEEGIFFELYSR
jgi:hypothetical protein